MYKIIEFKKKIKSFFNTSIEIIFLFEDALNKKNKYMLN